MMAGQSIPLLEPDWPAPDSVRCLITTRQGGVSENQFRSLNLAFHVGDQTERVQGNRNLLQGQHPEVKNWQWLEQVHSADVHRVDGAGEPKTGDGLVTASRGLACCVMTADCLPILICNESGTEVAAVHGGWRGLAADIIANALNQFSCDPSALLVWLGPAIGPCHFEVGEEVRAQFLAADPDSLMADHFKPQEAGKFLADLYGIARTRLHSLGVSRVYGGGFCTFCDRDLFYSYRRDGVCGRMLSGIYLR